MLTTVDYYWVEITLAIKRGDAEITVNKAEWIQYEKRWILTGL